MATIKDFYLGARPKTLSAAISPVLIGGALAFAAHKDYLAPLCDGDYWPGSCSDIYNRPSFNYIVLLACLVVAISLQIGVNYANDYSDGKKGTDDVRVGPMRLVGSGTASAKSVFIAMCISFFIASVAGLFVASQSSWWLILIGAICISLAYLYTGTKFAYGYFGFGELVVFICFGLVATYGTYFSTTESIIGNSDTFVLVASFIPGMFSVAILLANNIRDIETDRASNKKTLPARVGHKNAITLFKIAILLIFIAIATVGFKYHWALIALIVSPFLGMLNIKLADAKTPPDFVGVLVKTSKLNLLTSVLVSSSIVISSLVSS